MSANLVVALAGFGGAIGPEFYFAETSASAQRRGVFLQGVSGSPQLSLQPRSGSPDFLLPGDIWYTESGSSGDPNIFIAEQWPGEDPAAHRFVLAREGETLVQAISRFATSDAPTDLVVGANAVVLNGFFVTANTTAVSGALIKNVTWDGGFFMPDQNTIAVSGSVDLLVPSGALTIERGDLSILSGSVNVYSGNLTLFGETASFDISGSNVTASLLANSIVSIKTGSVDSASLSPIPIDGTMYINTASSDVSIRAGGATYELDVAAPGLVDGGTY